MSTDAASLAALTERAGFTDRSDCGRLWITGDDALDLLNRLTTNKLETLPGGTTCSTVLTNGDARVLDHLRLVAVDGGLWCITSPGRAEDVADWIDLYTFGEDVTVVDESSGTTQFTVLGPPAAEAIARAGFPAPPLDGVLAQDGAVVVASPFGTHLAYDVLLPLADTERTKAALLAAAQEVDAGVFEAYRIAQGVPAYGAEFGAFNNPLEARLLGSISDDKGCYTGQEVIARLQTYRKVQRLLMSFTSDTPAVPGNALETEDGSPAGTVTSAFNAGDGRALGLALVAAKHATAGSSLRLADGGSITLSEPAYALATEPVEV
ncbi:MAG: hypothetical protein F4Y96_06805 [Chloroflexi bacterium]|nr:hypothetical protein [Chloroflexota bacterium]